MLQNVRRRGFFLLYHRNFENFVVFRFSVVDKTYDGILRIKLIHKTTIEFMYFHVTYHRKTLSGVATHKDCIHIYSLKCIWIVKQTVYTVLLQQILILVLDHYQTYWLILTLFLNAIDTLISMVMSF